MDSRLEALRAEVSRVEVVLEARRSLHAIRNPLAGAFGMLQVLVDPLEDRPDLVASMEEVLQSLRRVGEELERFGRWLRSARFEATDQHLLPFARTLGTLLHSPHPPEGDPRLRARFHPGTVALAAQRFAERTAGVPSIRVEPWNTGARLRIEGAKETPSPLRDEETWRTLSALLDDQGTGMRWVDDPPALEFRFPAATSGWENDG
jgi:hypothetical protein